MSQPFTLDDLHLGIITEFYNDNDEQRLSDPKFHGFVEDAWIKDCHVLEYTGLKDKNGKKIFESDILKNEKGILGEVFYIPCEFHVMSDSQNEFDNFNYTGGVNQKTGNCEWLFIIGNIHENPELLK